MKLRRALYYTIVAVSLPFVAVAAILNICVWLCAAAAVSLDKKGVVK